MKKITKKLLLILGLIGVILIFSVMFYKLTLKPSLSEICSNNGFRWLEEYNECEMMNQDLCEKYNGKYFECGSACRHNPEADYCTQNCVAYCKFD